ncbi:DnaJ -like protein subfamily C member 4, partial [Toxocara canis]
ETEHAAKVTRGSSPRHIEVAVLLHCTVSSSIKCIMIDAHCSRSLKLVFVNNTRALHWCTPLFEGRNFYDVLGVSPKATQTEIKNAYYTKCKLVHPDSDSHLSEEERERRQRAFVELKAAYDVLRRPADRRIYDERLSGRMHPQYTAARQHRYHYHNYGPSTQQDWKAFWASTSGYKAEHMTAEDFKKQHEKQWAVVIRYTLIALGIVLAYHIGYLLLVYRRNRDLESLVAKDEIARSFLRQREFAHRRNDPEHAKELAQLLKADIDEAHQRRMESLKGKNSREIREEYRWLNAVRDVDPSKRFRLRRRAAMEEEESQRRSAVLKQREKASLNESKDIS